MKETIIRGVRAAYRLAFGRPRMQRVNDGILRMALRARGYMNHENLRLSGERAFIRLLAAHEPRLCVDVGANKGGYTQELLHSTNANVVAFEPLPVAFASLLSLERAFPGRLKAINKGVGSSDGQLTLHFDAADSSHASFCEEVSAIDYLGRNSTNSVAVDIVSLDSFFANDTGTFGDEIDLLKIDTEGFEYEVLVGAGATLAKMRPKFVQVEFNWHQLFRGHSLLELSKLLPEYRTYQLLPHGTGLIRRNPCDPESNFYHFSNFVFVRPDVLLR